jgi:hypothetical protein
MRNLIELLKGLVASRFYGEVTIKFEAGSIVHVRETRNHDPKMFSA